MKIEINEITAAAFAEMGDGDIQLAREGDGVLTLRLCEVKSLGVRGPRPAPPFSATLSAPDGTQLEQGTYAVLHPTLGRLELFLVPIGMQSDGPGYEIVFN